MPYATVGIAERLDQSVGAFAAFCAALPPALLRPQAWGPREVLSHIVFWHEAYIEMIDAQLKGKRPPYLEGAFSQLNANAVALLVDVPVPDLIRRLVRAQARLRRMVPAARRRRLHIAMKEGVKARDLMEFLSRVEAHIRGHHVALRRQRPRAA